MQIQSGRREGHFLREYSPMLNRGELVWSEMMTEAFDMPVRQRACAAVMTASSCSGYAARRQARNVIQGFT